MDRKRIYDILISSALASLEKESYIRGSDFVKAKSREEIPQFSPQYYLRKLKLEKKGIKFSKK